MCRLSKIDNTDLLAVRRLQGKQDRHIHKCYRVCKGDFVLVGHYLLKGQKMRQGVECLLQQSSCHHKRTVVAHFVRTLLYGQYCNCTDDGRVSITQSSTKLYLAGTKTYRGITAFFYRLTPSISSKRIVLVSLGNNRD